MKPLANLRAAAQAEQRLLILRLLLDDSDRSLNERLIRSGLSAYGHGMGTDQGRQLLTWLREADCLEIEELRGELWVAKLTTTGAEVVRAQTRIPGIAHPDDVG